MRWPWQKTPEINGPENAGFDDSFMGIAYRQVFELKAQPSPGAQAAAWETIALPAFTPIGPGNHAISKRLRAYGLAPLQVMSQQGARVVGVPTTAGQFAHQNLLVPRSERPPGGQV